MRRRHTTLVEYLPWVFVLIAFTLQIGVEIVAHPRSTGDWLFVSSSIIGAVACLMGIYLVHLRRQAERMDYIRNREGVTKWDQGKQTHSH